MRVWDSFGYQAGIGSTRLCSACCPMEASLPVHHRSGVSIGGGRRSFHPMGCPLAGLQRQLSPVHIQGTVAGDVAQPCWCHLRSGPQDACGTVLGALDLASSLMDHFPRDAKTSHDIPPMETQARLSMSTNRLHQSLAPACCYPLPRVPPKMLTRGFVSSRPKTAHVFCLSPPGQRALCVRAHLKEILQLGMVRLHKIFKPQQTHCNEKPLSPPKQPNFPLASGIFPPPPSAAFPQAALLGDYFHQYYI